MKVTRIRAIIVDDEQEGRDVLLNLLAKIPEVEVIGIAGRAEDGISAIVTAKPDLVFLDIKMPRKSGLDVVRELSEKQVRTSVVFVTAYDEFAIQAIRLAAFDFLLKPVDPDDLHQVIRRFQAEKLQAEFDRKIAILLSQYQKPPKIRLNTRTGFILVDPAEIIFIQADGNYSEIIFSQSRKEVVTQQIGALLEILPKNLFFRASRSALINLSCLRKVDRKCRKCELEQNGDVFTVPVSRDVIGEFDRLTL